MGIMNIVAQKKAIDSVMSRVRSSLPLRKLWSKFHPRMSQNEVYEILLTLSDAELRDLSAAIAAASSEFNFN